LINYFTFFIYFFVFYNFYFVFVGKPFLLKYFVGHANCVRYLITVRYPCHAGHYAENVVVNSVDTDLGSGNTGDGTGRKDKLKDGVVNSGEVA